MHKVNGMTLLMVAPFIHRILAAYRLDPAVRREVALELLAELVRAGAPTADTLRSWSQISRLLTRCAAELASHDEERSAYFARLARNSRDLWEAALEEVSARPIRASRRAPRIIDAVCTEVRS